jgi:hypothetical protein
VKFTSKTAATMNRYIGTASHEYAVTVKVAPSGSAAEGSVTVWVNATKYTATLADGSATIVLPKQKRGVYVVTAFYPGSQTVESSAGISGFIVTR